MDIPKLNKANNLNRRINELKLGLDQIEGKEQNPSNHKRKLVIEDESNGRELSRIPIYLTPDVVDFLKSKINSELSIALNEFNAL